MDQPIDLVFAMDLEFAIGLGLVMDFDIARHLDWS